MRMSLVLFAVAAIINNSSVAVAQEAAACSSCLRSGSCDTKKETCSSECRARLFNLDPRRNECVAKCFNIAAQCAQAALATCSTANACSK